MRKTAGPTAADAVPAVGHGRRGVDGHIGYLLRQAQSAHRHRMESALAPLGVTLPQFSVMTMVRAYPQASAADLARLALLTPQTMSVILANLERAGALARRPDPAHGRVRQLALTAAGQRLLARCRTATLSVEALLQAGLGARDEAVVRRWLVGAATAGDGAPD